MRHKIYFTIFSLGLFVAASFAQPNRTPSDPLSAHMIPPELIMQNQQAIGLSAEQRSSIINEISQAQVSFNELNWELRDQMELFTRILSDTKIDEERGLDQLANVLAIESKIKRAQITLMIRIKNYLSKEQQEKLKAIRTDSGIQ